MLRTGEQFSSGFSGCSARERDFLQEFEDAPHGSATFAEEVDEKLLTNYQDTLLKKAILSEETDENLRMLGTGATAGLLNL